MSRPPLDRATPSPRGIDPDKGEMTYFGLRFADLVMLAEQLAQDPSGVLIPGSNDTLAPGILEIPGKDRGLARSLIEIPAVLAHILGEHQSHYAAEAFLGTATLPDSLIRHSRRLAYEPDQGVAATGLAVFTVKDGLSGTLPLNFALQSEPKGDIKSQTYETLEDSDLSADWNDIRPVDAMRATVINFSDNIVQLPISGPTGLDVGEICLLSGRDRAAVCEVIGENDSMLHLLRVSDSDGTPWPASSDKEPYVVLAQPSAQTRIFGNAADPLTFPPNQVATPAAYVQADSDTLVYGYTVAGLSSGGYSHGSTLLLAETIEPCDPAAPVVMLRADSAEAMIVAESREAAVSFTAGQRIAIPQPPDPPSGFPPDQLLERSVSARATLLDLETPDGSARTWSSFPLDAIVLSGWTRQITVSPTEPDPSPLPGTVTLDTDLSDMRPGRMVVVESISSGHAASATIVRLEPVSDGWRAILSFDSGAVASDFALGDTRLRGNAVRVSHGESKSDILGGSDGITPHQSFTLKTPSVTRLVGATGGALELTVRVNGVLWDLVKDFHNATPDMRIARTEFDADQFTSVLYGGEGRGAVPPSGTRNLTADYRVGLGKIGDAEAGRLTRIKRASAILKSVTNPLPLSGGTDPARVEDMRLQATRPILTFDRAVSLQDHADLALTFPGIVRASARWLDRGAIELIAADANGDKPAEPGALRDFLDARRDTEVPLVLLDPQAVDITLSLRIERNRTWLADAVRREVTDLLLRDDPDAPGLFTFGSRGFSQPQSLSGLYDRLLGLEAATGAEANRFALKSQTGVADILHATDQQWLRLKPNDLVVDVVDPGTLIPDVESAL